MLLGNENLGMLPEWKWNRNTECAVGLEILRNENRSTGMGSKILNMGACFARDCSTRFEYPTKIELLRNIFRRNVL